MMTTSVLERLEAYIGAGTISKTRPRSNTFMALAFLEQLRFPLADRSHEGACVNSGRANRHLLSVVLPPDEETRASGRPPLTISVRAPEMGSSSWSIP